MRVAPRRRQLEFLQPDSRRSNAGEHGHKRNQPEHESYCNDQSCVLLCRRVHEQRNKRLAGPQDEQDEYRPGRDRAPGTRIVDVRMVCVVIMLVVMHNIFMNMNMRMPT